MNEWWNMLILFVLCGVMYLVTRNDYDEKKRLSKKGFIKIIVSSLTILVVAVVLGFLAGH